MINEASPLAALIWPSERLGEALELLARKLGYLAQPVELPGLPAHLAQADDAEVGRWLTAAAGQLRLEVEAVQVGYDEVDGFVRQAAPALVRLRGETPGVLVLLKAGPRWVSLLGPDLSTRRVPPGQIRAALCQPLEAPFAPYLTRLLTEAGVSEHRRAKAAAAILAEQLGSQPLSAGWLLRLPPGGNFWRQMWHAGLVAPAAATIGGQVLQQAMGILAWVMIGRAVFAGYFEPAWLLAWALVLFSAIPFQLLTRWGQNQVSLKAGGLFKQRLLFGTLQLESDEVRHQGAGQFLGRVMESEAVEMLAINGGFMAIVSVIELAMAAAVLAAGAGGWAHALLLAGWTALALGLGWRYYRRNTGRTDAYRAMTNDQVEGMVGHRTRLAQEDHRRWHDKEDQTLAHYLKLLEEVDGIGLQLSGFIPRGWLLVGMAGLAYTFIFQPASTVELAVSVGGIMLAYQALSAMIGGLGSVISLLIAWGQVKPLFAAAARPESGPRADLSLSVLPPPARSRPGETLLTARELTFRYRPHGKPVLNGCSLAIHSGDRLLLEGPSGGGKSTLAAVLAGLRRPESGLLLWQGLDWQTIGAAAWRQRVVSAPQFHENHVFTETFAFNLLMGRQWPASPEDLAEAEIICQELGLGDLLARMPAGFQQMVGESGWQLSHGERSRLYIARALLQNADLIILDESFAALDPENLHRTLQSVFNRAPTLLVIAHP